LCKREAGDGFNGKVGALVQALHRDLRKKLAEAPATRRQAVHPLRSLRKKHGVRQGFNRDVNADTGRSGQAVEQHVRQRVVRPHIMKIRIC
jgi:hypothetical protein